MLSLTVLVQALGLAYAAGLNLYATVAIVGLSERIGWIGPLPGSLALLGSWWVIAIALVLFALEFTATLVPGIASAWETLHSLVRPPAAAVLAASTAWHLDPVLVLVAALLGGVTAATTHATKLGVRYAIDASPEPVTNGAANITELGVVAALSMFIWHHPFISFACAIALLLALIVTVRLIWRMLRRVFSGQWAPSRGFLQAARVTECRPVEQEKP